jgi:hypothetical protein
MLYSANVCSSKWSDDTMSTKYNGIIKTINPKTGKPISRIIGYTNYTGMMDMINKGSLCIFIEEPTSKGESGYWCYL